MHKSIDLFVLVLDEALRHRWRAQEVWRESNLVERKREALFLYVKGVWPGIGIYPGVSLGGLCGAVVWGLGLCF